MLGAHVTLVNVPPGRARPGGAGDPFTSRDPPLCLLNAHNGAKAGSPAGQGVSAAGSCTPLHNGTSRSPFKWQSPPMRLTYSRPPRIDSSRPQHTNRIQTGDQRPLAARPSMAGGDPVSSFQRHTRVASIPKPQASRRGSRRGSPHDLLGWLGWRSD